MATPRAAEMTLGRCIAVLFILAGCRGKPASAPAAGPPPPLPAGFAMTGSLFALDTEQPHIAGVLHGAGAGVALDQHLTSASGERELLITTATGTRQVASGGWNLLFTGAAKPSGEALLCWNRLTGAASGAPSMPHPGTGLAVACRSFANGTLGPELAVEGTTPGWLEDVTVETDGTWTIGFRRNADGWLVTPPQAGDGSYRRSFDGAALGPALPAAQP